MFIALKSILCCFCLQEKQMRDCGFSLLYWKNDYYWLQSVVCTDILGGQVLSEK